LPFKVVHIIPTIGAAARSAKAYVDRRRFLSCGCGAVVSPSEEICHTSSRIQIGAKVVWMQEGFAVKTPPGGARAGLEVIMDQCMRANHRRLIGERFSL
jgi:hypothetical protein